MMNRVIAATLIALTACLMIHPAGAVTPVNAGMHMLETENYSGAQQWFEAALAKNPKDVEATSGMAKLSLAQGHGKAGVTWAKKAVALAPTDAASQILLAEAYIVHVNDVSIFHKLGIAHKIRAAFQQAVKLAPKSPEARVDLYNYYAFAPGIAGGDADKAKVQLAALRKIDPARADMAQANLAWKNKHQDKAEALLRKAAKLDDSGDAENYLGLFLTQQKNYAAAITTFKAGIQKAPTNSANYYQLGRVAVLSKTHVQEGIKALKQYLSMPHDWQTGGPSYKWGHYRLGMLYGIAGNKNGEKAEYQAALTIDPKFKEVKKALGAM